jgi:hypothetical protein
MEKLDTIKIKSPVLNRNILMAAQRSAFQDSISWGIDIHHTSDFVFIKTIDVSTLPEINLLHFDATIGESELSNATSYIGQTLKKTGYRPRIRKPIC